MKDEAREKVVSLNRAPKFDCPTHGSTNHVVGWSGGIVCVPCFPTIARQAQNANVRD